MGNPCSKGTTGANCIPENATGCYGAGCDKPVSQTIDNHVNKSISEFNVEATTDVGLTQSVDNKINLVCNAGDAAIDASKAIGLAMLGSDGKYDSCSMPGYCGGIDASITSNSDQKISLKDITTYEPQVSATNQLNLESIVKNSSANVDTSVFGNSKGPSNMQQQSNIQLNGQDISKQSASFTKQLKANINNNTTNGVNLVTDNVMVVPCLHKPPPTKVNINSISDQAISSVSEITNAAAITAMNSAGIKMDLDKEDKTEHHGVDLNGMVKDGAGMVNNLVDTVGDVANNGIDSAETASIIFMLSPAIIILALCLGLWAWNRSSKKSPGLGSADLGAADLGAADLGATDVSGDGTVTQAGYTQKSGGSNDTLDNIISLLSTKMTKPTYLDTININNHQLIIIIIIIIIIYNNI